MFSPYADKGTLELAEVYRRNANFAAYFPISLLNQIPRGLDGGSDQTVLERLHASAKIVFSDHNSCWLVHAPDHDKISDEVALTSAESSLDSSDDTVESYVTYCGSEDLNLRTAWKLVKPHY